MNADNLVKSSTTCSTSDDIVSLLEAMEVMDIIELLLISFMCCTTSASFLILLVSSSQFSFDSFSCR